MRTGDIVFHRPTGETWTVACVRDDRLSWCGWPEGTADLVECDLLQECSDDDHWRLVEEIAQVRGDHRGEMCRRLLADKTLQTSKQH